MNNNSNNDDDTLSFDPNVIIQAAEDKRQQNDVAGAQIIYQSALLNWVDAVREGGLAVGQDAEQAREAIATLWLAYAHFNQSINMFKSATDAYEQALVCPVARSVGRVWLDYARFAQDRDKFRTAQSIYLRALVGTNDDGGAVVDEQDRQLLWNEFLEMMKQTTNKPELTLVELKRAVEEEHVQQQKQNNNSASTTTTGQHNDVLLHDDDDRTSPDLVTSTTAGNNDEAAATSPQTMERPEKRQRIDAGNGSLLAPPPLPTTTMEAKTHVITAEAVSAEATDLEGLVSRGGGSMQLPPEISAAWFVRDGDSHPSPPEPPLFSPSPPKLADPTGKDILGTKLALAVITRLLKKDDHDSSGTTLLEVCRGLWMLSALTEKKSAEKIDLIDKSITTQMEELDQTLETRLSVAGAASSAVQQLNENERSAFQQSCYQRRQEALNSIAWDFRNLLCTQQQVLTKLQVPGFDGPTVDANALELQSRLCSYLHSAFYLRARIGEAPHQAMLKSQAERLKNDVASHQQPSEPTTNLPPQPPPVPPFPVQQQLPPAQAMYSPAFPQYATQPMAYAQQFPGSQQVHILPQGMQPTAPTMQYGQQPQPPYYQHQQQ